MKIIHVVLGLALVPTAARAGNWVLDQSELTYHVSHRLHKVEGSCRTARGKGVCDGDGCQFLVAAPVGSFQTGDTNRDLHMLETTRGAKFPIVKVEVAMPEVPREDHFAADLSIEFAGKKSTYKGVEFVVASRPSGKLHFTGTIPLNIDDFAIPAPSLFGMAIKSQVPVSVDMTWAEK